MTASRSPRGRATRTARAPESPHAAPTPRGRTRVATRTPAAPSRCARCKATWMGAEATHCAGCHQTFASLELFDAHRRATGERGICRDPATMVRRNGERVTFCRGGIWVALDAATTTNGKAS